MALLISDEDEIYAHATRLLRKIVPSTSFAQDLADSSRSLSRALERAVADTAQLWNASSPSDLQRIPPEVLGHCVHWLAFNDRLTASHVSRHFRAVTLADPTLWSRIRVTPAHSDAVGLQKVNALLDRSAAAPLELCFTRTASRAEIQACRPHFQRLRAFELAKAMPLDGFDCVMPLLESFHIAKATKDVRHVEVLASWAGNGAPKLRSLSLPLFVLPGVVQPFRSVTHFSGRLGDNGNEADASQLFTFFPRLVSLSLIDVSGSSRMPQGPVPSSLQEVFLASWQFIALDHSRFLEPFATRPLRRLQVCGTQNIASMLRIFTSSRDNDWTMTVSFNAIDMSILGDGRSTDYFVRLVARATPVLWEGTSAYFSRLKHLTASLYELGTLVKARLTMPQLRRIIIDLTEGTELKPQSLGYRDQYGGDVCLTAPLLRVVHIYNATTVERDGGGYIFGWFEQSLIQLLQDFIVHDGVLKHLSYTGAGDPSFQGKKTMCSLAHEVVFNGAHLTIPSDDGGEGTSHDSEPT